MGTSNFQYEIEEKLGRHDESIITEEYLILKFEKHNLTYFKYLKKDMLVDRDDVIEIKNFVSKLWDGKPSYSLCDFREIRGSYSKDAQQYSAQDEGIASLKHKEAIVIDSLGLSFLVGIYFRYFGPKTTTKCFSSIQDGIDWLLIDN